MTDEQCLKDDFRNVDYMQLRFWVDVDRWHQPHPGKPAQALLTVYVNWLSVYYTNSEYDVAAMSWGKGLRFYFDNQEMATHFSLTWT